MGGFGAAKAHGGGRVALTRRMGGLALTRRTGGGGFAANVARAKPHLCLV